MMELGLKTIVELSNLPEELWLEISKHVKSAIDIVRFRSICRLWRSLLPLPSSYTCTHRIPNKYQIIDRLYQTKTYRLEPILPHSSSSSSSTSSKGWFIKIVGGSKRCLLSPFCVGFLNPNPKQVLNMMDFRVVELFEEYTFKLLSENYDESNHRKVVLFENHIIFVLYTDGILSVSKIGDKNSIVIHAGKNKYEDILVHKRNVYIVDKWGAIWWIKINRSSSSSSFEFVQFSPTINDAHGEKKHLVEFDGSLYVIDTSWRYSFNYLLFNVQDVKVYKLDEEWGKWINVKDLGDVLFVLGKDSNFSLSSRDYYGCQGNCIYFTAYFAATQRIVCAFNLESSRINKSPHTFWPCPSLFTSNCNLQMGD